MSRQSPLKHSIPIRLGIGWIVRETNKDRSLTLAVTKAFLYFSDVDYGY